MRQNIFITGSSGNLGRACIETFLKKDCTVIATASPGKRPDLISPDLQVVAVDLTDEKMVSDTVGEVIRSTPIHAAVLTVGGFATGNILDTDGALIKKMLALNFESAFHCTRKLLEQMKKEAAGGKIFFIGSRPALYPEQGKDMIAYALSKSLLFRLAESINAEKSNVKAYIIVPGTIDTPENRSWKPAGDPSWVSPQEIAEQIAALALEEQTLKDGFVVKMFAPK